MKHVTIEVSDQGVNRVYSDHKSDVSPLRLAVKH